MRPHTRRYALKRFPQAFRRRRKTLPVATAQLTQKALSTEHFDAPHCATQQPSFRRSLNAFKTSVPSTGKIAQRRTQPQPPSQEKESCDQEFPLSFCSCHNVPSTCFTFPTRLTQCKAAKLNCPRSLSKLEYSISPRSVRLLCLTSSKFSHYLL